MPNYNYQCSQCGHKLQEFQTMSEKALTKCPECKKNKLERLISGGSGVIFKGSGFYETDYKKKPNTDTKSETTPAVTEGSSKSSTAESKSEATPAPASTRTPKESKS
jgi:putative FmdB family regulatory protein